MIPKKSQINRTVNVGLKELKKFKGNEQTFIYLQQAGNKMYKAYTQLLEYHVKKDIRNTRDIETVTFETKDKDLIKIFKLVIFSHSYFYEGELGKNDKDDVIQAAKEIKSYMKTHK